MAFHETLRAGVIVRISSPGPRRVWSAGVQGYEHMALES